MSQYQAIKAATNAYIKTNGRQEITGAILNAVMIATIDSLGRFYQFVGYATPDTDPGNIDQNIAYLAGTPGTYSHLGGFTLAPGEVAVLKFDGQWKKEVVIVIPSKVSQLENDLGFITNAVSDLLNYYSKEETDSALGNYFTKQQVADILSAYYDKEEVDSIIASLTRQSYVVAWDGTAEPVVGDIPAGVSVTWGGNPYVGTLPASASTIGRIYLVSNGAGYDEYITTEDGGYSWVGIGTTSIDLSDYATKAEVNQLEAKVDSLPRGKDYGFFASSSLLPSDATEEGFAYVGATEPYAIWQFDGTTWSDSGVTAVAFAAPQDQVKDAVDDYLDEHPTVSGTFTNTAKRALIALLEKVAYIDGDGQSYIDILNVALNDVPIDHIDAVFTQGDLKVYDGFSTLNDLKANLVVTAYYADGSTAVIPDYELSGTLTAGTSTITVTVDEEFTDTFTVAVTATTKLYMDGDECTANSGGWQVKGFYKTAGSPVTSKESDHLLIQFNSSATEAKTFSTINKVDIDTNTVILVECEPWTGAGTGVFWAYYPSTLADATTQESAFGADYADNRDSLADASLGQMTGQSKVVRKTITATHTEAYISLNLNLWSSPSAGAYVKITKVALATE